jgi:hypothetical protein
MKKVIISPMERLGKNDWLKVTVMAEGGSDETSSIIFYHRTKPGYSNLRSDFRKLEPLPSRDDIEFIDIGGQMKEEILELLYGKSGG